MGCCNSKEVKVPDAQLDRPQEGDLLAQQQQNQDGPGLQPINEIAAKIAPKANKTGGAIEHK